MYTVIKRDGKITDFDLKKIANNQRTSLIHEGMQFDVDVLNQERQRIARAMRRNGCYYFNAFTN